MTHLEARYGRTRAWSRRERALGIVAGLAVLVTATLWVWSLGTDLSRTTLQTRDLGFEIVDDSTIEVVFEVTVEPGTPVSCAVEALNSAYTIVGWRETDLPASERRTETHVLEVRTTERPTTGLVSECWLP
ncbi:hypothetical protein L332_11095 [Agrococcus pavilionensis RW1]|uniref:DUF4307 domain-containing protein n=1 Tax=Agrococcus pavilionensis RW1 TaxID=1330458 RepID=U1MSS6_9MICO|nr:DUF4307 domain-containing protein [Agrococcus pavilionensis]ERG64986.1 hypothetical protein L332_11095 [Agrococcus pavilionensis RW1]